MKQVLLLFTFTTLLIGCVLTQGNVKSTNWLQGNHDEYQTNRIALTGSTSNFNISLKGSPTIVFDRDLVLVDAQRNVLITNFALYDGEKFPQLDDFGLSKVDLTTGKLSRLNYDTDRPAFNYGAISKAVLSPQGIYYFALSRQHSGLNFVFTYNMTSGTSNYYSIPFGIQVDGLAFVDNTVYISNFAALGAYTPEMTLKWTRPTGFTYGQASNLITTQESGKNVIYYGVQNVLYRLDTFTTNVVQFELASNIMVKSISYLGNGNVLIVANDNSQSDDVIYAVNVITKSSVKLQTKDANLGRMIKCTNALNIQKTPLSTYSILSCGKHQGTERDRNAIGILFDTSSVPSLTVDWHLPIQAESVHFSATQNNDVLMTNDYGYIVLDIQSGKMISAKKSSIANSSCKIITGMNSKFYSVCSNSDTSIVTIASNTI